MQIVSLPNLPPPAGHYSPAVIHNGTIYVSGQLPIDPISKTNPASIEEQTLLVLQKIETIVIEAGSTKERILQMRIYISDGGLWEQVNKTYASFFGGHKPARCIIPTKELHFGSLIEAEAIAHC